MLSELAEPLTRLCKWDVMQTWDSQEEIAPKKIKSIICSLPALVYFDQDKNHIFRVMHQRKELVLAQYKMDNLSSMHHEL